MNGCDANYPVGAEQLGTASYRGMIMCGPMPENGASDYTVHFGGNKVDVNEWQCTEAAMRYLWLAYGQSPYVANGGQVVDNYVNNVKGALLARIANVAGSGNVPSDGDVISLTNSGAGHVAIVTDVSGVVNGYGPIKVIDENGIPGPNKTNGTGAATYQDTNYFIDGSSEQATVEAWLHPKTTVPSYSGSESGFQSVSSFSANNVWAVGGYSDAGGNSHTLIEHSTDGGQTWLQDTSYTGAGVLNAVDGTSLSDAWAVGNDPNDHPLALHLSNGKWSSVVTSAPPNSTLLDSVSEHSKSDIWVVGWTVPSNQTNAQTFTMHYLNGSWTTIPSPNPDTNSYLSGVFNLGGNNEWAVGYTGTTGFIIHWTGGSSWNPATSLSLGSNSSLFSVAALNAKNIWAAGYYLGGALIYHSSDGGMTWQQVTTDNPKSNPVFYGIVVNKANGNTWAVGDYQPNPDTSNTLTEFFN
jgi:hypothetical protein